MARSLVFAVRVGIGFCFLGRYTLGNTYRSVYAF